MDRGSLRHAAPYGAKGPGVSKRGLDGVRNHTAEIEGFPLHSEPDTSTFTSTTSFTRAPLGPGGPYFGANLVRG
jgi:hypothetical protein